MKNGVIVLGSLFLLLTLSTIALANAVPGVEKNNDKFQPYSDRATSSFLGVLLADHEYIPSNESINRLIINQDETFMSYNVTVNGRTYHLGKDFAYTGHAVYTFNKPVFNLSSSLKLLYPVESQTQTTVVNYMFDFSAFSGGIEGTLQFRAEFTQGGQFINSLAGTGDLRNVQVKATNNPPSLKGLILTISHTGTVQGWPDIPPAS